MSVPRIANGDVFCQYGKKDQSKNCAKLLTFALFSRVNEDTTTLNDALLSSEDRLRFLVLVLFSV